MRRTEARVVRALLQEKGRDAFLELALRYGKTFRHQGAVVTCDPEVVRALLMDRANTDERPAVYKAMAKLPGADGILFMDGEKWRTRAHALAPVFQRNHAEAFAASLHETANAHAEHWHAAGRGADLYDAIQQLGATSVLAMGYGLAPADADAHRLARALVEYKQHTMTPDARKRIDRVDGGIARLLSLPWLLATTVRLRGKVKNVRTALDAVLAHNRRDVSRVNWLQQLCASGISGTQLVNEINHLYGAFNAIDFIVTAALVELARRGWTERLRAEMISVLGADRVPVRDDLAKLPQTNAFMLEILRRYPVSMGVVRRVGNELEIEGERVPTGSQVMISPYALQHHPDFWGSDALEMKPERWLVSPTPAVPFSYVPFLEGPRKCLGRNMAEMQLLVVLSAIARRFDLRVPSEPMIPPFLIPRFGAPIPFEIFHVH